MLTAILPMIALFLAGLLVGHLLWYRDAAHDQQTIDQLQTSYTEALWEARQTRSQRTNLTNRIVELESLAERYQAHVCRLEQDLAASQQSLASENRRSETLVEQLREVLQSRTQMEQLTAGTVEQLQVEQRSLQQQLEMAAGDYLQAQQQIKSLKHQLGELGWNKIETRALQQRVDELTAQLAEFSHRRAA